VLGAALAVRLARRRTSQRLAPLREWIESTPLRAFVPMLGWFVVLALLDISVQWLATHAFGAPIGFVSLLARVPILYIAFTIPSFGNFGTRELTWAALFSDHHPRDVLIAYAFATNALFLVFHVVLGALFVPRALALLREVREARREGAMLGPPALAPMRDPAEP
jgi:hypothetical protein